MPPKFTGWLIPLFLAAACLGGTPAEAANYRILAPAVARFALGQARQAGEQAWLGFQGRATIELTYPRPSAPTPNHRCEVADARIQAVDDPYAISPAKGSCSAADYQSTRQRIHREPAPWPLRGTVPVPRPAYLAAERSCRIRLQNARRRGERPPVRIDFRTGYQATVDIAYCFFDARGQTTDVERRNPDGSTSRGTHTHWEVDCARDSIHRVHRVNVPLDVRCDTSRATPVMENLVGMNTERARARLRSGGHRIRISMAATPDVRRANTVREHSPPPGARIWPGEDVTLRVWVYGGVQEVHVPDLAGLSAVDASARLRLYGLAQAPAAPGDFVPTCIAPNIGKVAGQAPPPETRVRRGSSVRVQFFVHRPAVMPAVVNVPVGEAFRRIHENCLNVGNIRVLPAPRPEDHGKVVSTLPTAGTSMRPGSVTAVAVYAKTNPPNPQARQQQTVPDLSGLSIDMALHSLWATRLNPPASIGIDATPHPGRIGRVSRQGIAPRAHVAYGRQVQFWILWDAAER